MTDDQQQLTIMAIVLAFIFWPRQTSVDVGLRQVCIYPDNSVIQVNLGDECPFDSSHGGASVLAKECPGNWIIPATDPCPPFTV